jgi:hypothetical protein
MKKKFVLACVLLCIVGAQSFGSVSYSGSLTVIGGGLEGTGFWITNNGDTGWFPATFSWTVSQNLDSTWHYEYNLDVHRADVSHFIVETSPSFGYSNLLNADYPGSAYEIQLHEQGSVGNPYLPDDVYGSKFGIGQEGTLEPDYTSITVSFDSDRAPVWGDIYAKCGAVGGTQNTLWNEGFVTADPLDGPSDGSVLNHVLVPDTIPEPATVSLLTLGALALRRKRK